MSKTSKAAKRIEALKQWMQENKFPKVKPTTTYSNGK